jgi:solute:Na+ symporter, SSS family
VVWAAVLILVAYLSRQVEFVLNAAFSLRGLTSGALLGGLALAIFWRQRRAAPVVVGMLASLSVMTAIQVLPKLSCTGELWMRLVGTEIFWPWYTLVGATVTLVTAWSMSRWFFPRAKATV